MSPLIRVGNCYIGCRAFLLMVFYFIVSSSFEFGGNRTGMEYRNFFNKILISNFENSFLIEFMRWGFELNLLSN